jgi:lactate permease
MHLGTLMTLAFAMPWPQPLDPFHSVTVSALIAAIPLLVVLILMGGLRRSGLTASVCGLATAVLLAIFLWHMPAPLIAGSIAFGAVYAVWPILWMVFAALWLYNLTQDTGHFELLRRWMQSHASGDPAIQAILVAFAFGALLEGTSGFGAPVAVTSCLLVGLGFEARKAVLVALIANTAPVAFGGLGIPIVALAGVTGLPLGQLSAMVGRQVPLLSFILPAYLVWVVGRGRGLKRTWPAALVAGGSFAFAQFVVSNYWGPYVADVLAACFSIAALAIFLKLLPPAVEETNTQMTTDNSVPLSTREAFAAWFPWAMLSVIIVSWSWLNLLPLGSQLIPVPALHNGVFITLYQKAYAALYNFQPLGPGSAALVAAVITAIFFRVRPRVFFNAGARTLRQLVIPGLTVITIVALAYLYNYSGMAFTLGAAIAHAGPVFPVLSSYLGWIACFLSGSDTASNVLFGNLQVAAAHQLHLSPLLLAATNSSGAVAGKMISPQNIAIGVTTVGLVGQEGKVLRATFWHSILLAGLIGLLAFAQAYWLSPMIPHS